MPTRHRLPSICDAAVGASLSDVLFAARVLIGSANRPHLRQRFLWSAINSMSLGRFTRCQAVFPLTSVDRYPLLSSLRISLPAAIEQLHIPAFRVDLRPPVGS